jgi:hypothetical protein
MSPKRICWYILHFSHKCLRVWYYSIQCSKHMEQARCPDIHEVSFRSAYPVHVGWNKHAVLLFPICSCVSYRFMKVNSGRYKRISWKICLFYFATFSFTSFFSTTYGCNVLGLDSTWFIRSSSTSSKNLTFWDHRHIFTNNIRKGKVFVMLELIKSKLYLTPKYFMLP